MADGSHQQGFHFPAKAFASALRPGEIVLDFFAGGGGASEALRQALGRDPDVAVNHDPQAIGMHAANHPYTRHMEADVWTVDILREVAGRPTGWMHASPDCTHHSQARGGQPRDRKIRSLAWVVVKVAGILAKHGLAPRIISLENVKQMLLWGQLIAKRDKATGRVVKLDGTLAAPGERVPIREQFLVPDKRRMGSIWIQFVKALRALGYQVESFKLRADQYGAGTDRERLYLVARRDGLPIVKPEPTHGDSAPQAAACANDHIDWNLLGASIFNRKRPLKPNTIRRLLDGARRANWPQPYIDALVALRDGRQPNLMVTPEEAEEISRRFGHKAGLVMATASGGIARETARPVPTITAGGNGAAPHFIRPIVVYRQNTQSGVGGCSVDKPMPTATIRGAGYLAEPIVAPYYGSGSGTSGQPSSRRIPTITTKGRFGLAEPVVISTCNSSSAGVRLGSDAVRTITTARGGDMAVAEPVLAEYRIDILYRMLVERELFNAQGFPPDYVIDRTASGKRITRAQAIRMVGNSVSPPPLAAIARANLNTALHSVRGAA